MVVIKGLKSIKHDPDWYKICYISKIYFSDNVMLKMTMSIKLENIIPRLNIMFGIFHII